MLSPLTPSPLTSTQREALQPTLQPLLYGLVLLTSSCHQAERRTSGLTGGWSFLTSLGELYDGAVASTADLSKHMVALGLPVDVTVEGAADNNPFSGTFSSGETDAATLGAEVLDRCRQVAVMVRTALAAADGVGALETVIELQAVALAVSRSGGRLAQALR